MSNWKTIAIGIATLVLTAIHAPATTPTIANVTAKQRYPWNGKVDISYNVTKGEMLVNPVKITATDRTSGMTYTANASALSGDTGTENGNHHVIWDLNAQRLQIKSDNVIFKVIYELQRYCIIDLSAGANASTYPVSYVNTPPSGGFNKDEYKTTKLVLRLIDPGTFIMCEEYSVTLTKPFYCGLFEVTQKQYSLITGSNPSGSRGDKRPVEQVSYDLIRGSTLGSYWPLSSSVNYSSVIGQIRTRTGLDFDLPTEAQWEYACRAGTTSKFNNGGSSESDLMKLGRYEGNLTDNKGGYSNSHTTVGSYLPNAWGIYDMHGNVDEWCLDWIDNLSGGANDPVGAHSSDFRVYRGGCWYSKENNCSSAKRKSLQPRGYGEGLGFRLVLTLTE